MGQKATTQSFDFEPNTVDSQLQKLQACFTDQGWQSFNSALQKSGNLDAIKSQSLHVSSQIDGQPQITEALGNQWKITLPLQVVYQNDKEKVTQLLNVNLTVGRKITGDLGINQMIATPRTTTLPINSSTGASSTTGSTTTQTNQGTPTNTTTTTPDSSGSGKP
nr:DotI/IcmL family type IV secretion protein [Legionella norrlandica]